MMNLKLDGVCCTAGFFNSAHAAQGRRAWISRTVTTYELQWIRSENSLVSINGDSYTLQSGDVLCLHPGDTCRIPMPYCSYYVRISGVQGELACMLDAWDHVMSVPNTENNIKAVCAIAESGRREDVLTQMAQLLLLLSDLERCAARDRRLETAARKKTQEALRAGMEYMEDHYCEKCTLKEIAAHADRSPIYFHDIFGEIMGITPYEYIAELRLGEAKRRLSLTDEDPLDIAKSCGFCSQSYFNYVFKKATGITPLNYRRDCAAQYTQDDAMPTDQ